CEIEEHADHADGTAIKMAERTLGADDIGKLAPPGVDQQHRHDGEGGAEEHHLAERYRLLAEIAHAGRQQREQKRRERFKKKGFDQVHRAAKKHDALLSRGSATTKAISNPVA